jgi:hypothetical protein
MMEDRFLKRLRKKARKGLRGWPMATIAFYGPNLSQATKVTVGIVPSENAEVKELRDWKVDRGDIRGHPDIAREILEFIEKHRVLSVAMTDSIEWLNVQNTKVGFCNLDAESEPINTSKANPNILHRKELLLSPDHFLRTVYFTYSTLLNSVPSVTPDRPGRREAATSHNST